MSRKIFLDVGAWEGATAKGLLLGGFPFDHIYCFEPSPTALLGLLRTVQGLPDKERVKVLPFGLWDRTGFQRLYHSGNAGASIFPQKPRWREGPVGVSEEDVLLLQGSSALDALFCLARPSDRFWMKVNVEGAECDLLEDLLDTGWVPRFEGIAVDFDVEKVLGEEDRKEDVLEAFHQAGLLNKLFYPWSRPESLKDFFQRFPYE